MVRGVPRVTCLSTLKDGVTVNSPDDREDKIYLTLQEGLDLYDPDDDEEDEEDDEHDNVLRRFFYSSHCTVCAYIGLLLLLTGSIAAFIVVSVQVVQPYVRVRDFVRGTCTPIALIVEDGKTCMCGAGCTAQYRCLTIKVSYEDEWKNLHNATVYENESTLDKQCSFYPPCRSSGRRPPAIEAAVREYEARYGTLGEPFSCLHSRGPTAAGTAVIRTRRFTSGHVAHGLTWSAVAATTSIVLCVVCVMRRGCDFW